MPVFTVIDKLRYHHMKDHVQIGHLTKYDAIERSCDEIAMFAPWFWGCGLKIREVRMDFEPY